MTKNGHQSTKQSDFLAGRVLLLRQVTEKKEKTHPTHFLMISLASPQTAHLVLPAVQAVTSQNQKGVFFSNRPSTSIL